MFWSNEDSYKELKCFNSTLTLETPNSFLFDNFGVDKNSSGFLLKHLPLDHPNNIVIGHLKNSISKNLIYLKKEETEEIDILMITEANLHDSFPASQFLTQGFCTSFTLDQKWWRNSSTYQKQYNITKLNKYIIKNQTEAFFVEIRTRNSVWLLYCSYNPDKLQIASHIQEVPNEIDAYCSKYKNILIMGDFKVDVKEVSLHLFCSQYKLKSLNKDPTCYKDIGNPSYIDLLLTSSAKNHESTCTIETVLSYFHKPVATVMSSTNGCLRKLYSTEIIKSLITQSSIIIFANKQKI